MGPARGDSRGRPEIAELACRVYRAPTDQPEADGTFEWSETTIVTVEVHAAGETDLGWTYASAACKGVIAETLPKGGGRFGRVRVDGDE